MKLLYCLVLTSLIGCSESPTKNNDIDLPEISDEIENTFIDRVINDLSTDGNFICINVSNKGQKKKLVIENGRFYNIFSENEKIKKDEFIKIVRPVIVSQCFLPVKDKIWNQFLTNLVDTNENISNSEYQYLKNKYFKFNRQIVGMDSITIKKIAIGAFNNHVSIYFNHDGGYYYLHE